MNPHMKQSVKIIASVLLVVLVGINGVASQQFPSLLFDLVDANNPHVARAFLTQIASSKEYYSQYSLFDGMFHQSISQEILKEQEVVRKSIKRLETARIRSPHNPGVLIALSQQYDLVYDTENAREARAQALEVDPTLNIRR